MKIGVNHDRCSGCRACEVICSLARFKEVNPKKAALKISGEFPVPGTYRINYCDQCGQCADACPVEAIVPREGVYLLDQALCTGCGSCVEACPYGVIIIPAGMDVPVKCELCGECFSVCNRNALFNADLA